MLFISREYLKPGMILAKDINLYSGDSFTTILLKKGQILSNLYINKIIYHDIPGVYIKSDTFNDLIIESKINQKLESESISQIKDVYQKFKNTMGKIDIETIKQISIVVNKLISEILSKESLSNNIIDFKSYDDYTYQHCLNVAVLSISTGISLGFSEYELHELGMCGLMHDIGKMLIPLSIINKPGKLTKEEFEIMKTHPINSVNQLQYLVSSDVLRGIESHHEKIDGTGYPYGRKGNNIHRYGKILSVCDVYDALTSTRSYRKSCFPSEVIEYIMGCADTHFDYEILSKFLKNIVAYPVGTFVKLSNDKIAVVVKNYSDNIMRPLVRIINDDNTIGEDIDLLNDHEHMNIIITGMGYKYGHIDYNSITKANPKQGDLDGK
ncbi:HD-GYP domain-containing protein (c-di-GMP phosphodiesterase class II) [Sedimentibacter acidaminivorans]|uniref:HD-GYP domain-containing protein (C-di-GMP phosphodiesterase class II) n=1 Tax=Sedimentibacter acidaminivorans TaxID=913099 RepID=A0ABS4GF96_9FIRM|nr:HD-GYP domain-containing protein [Sedimentibacter acidaminivorans]MBP1926366.1 HD-GYP domain-containing protein (c-di-GMP phosphodiesterase class II) [Sedimentibacter acidaminivorans]